MGYLYIAAFCLFLVTGAPGWAQVDYPETYSASPLSGRVVDAATDQPLEGVIIVAQWILYRATVGGDVDHGRLHVLETVTDADGRYQFPGWGPKPNPIEIIPRLSYCCFMREHDPQLSLFKPGYRPRRLLNEKPHDPKPALRTSTWDGKTIRLEPFQGSLNEWATRLHFLQGDLGWNKLDWRACPRMVLAIEQERLRLPIRTDWSVAPLSYMGTSLEEVRRELGASP
jgi:hypothetical protein